MTGSLKISLSRFAKNSLLTLISLTLPAASFADDLTQSLARFVEGEDSLENLIKFPDVEGDVDRTSFCWVYVEKSGRLSAHQCLTPGPERWKFNRAIRVALRSAKATPAIVDGERYYVRLHFRAVFTRKDGENSVQVFPNWGEDSDTYGQSYDAPQLYVQQGITLRCYRMYDSVMLLSVPLDEIGRPVGESSVTQVFGERQDSICNADLRDYLEVNKYIPARKDGQPVKATYATFMGDISGIEIPSSDGADPPE